MPTPSLALDRVECKKADHRSGNTPAARRAAPGNSGGESETIIGRWLARRGRSDDEMVATKVSQHPQFQGLAPDTVARAADASLRRLGVDHIDLYYAHYDDQATPLADAVAAFGELVREGKVPAVGLSDDRGRVVLAALDEVAAAQDDSVAAVALAWVRHQDGVAAPIASARTVEQVGPLLASARITLTPDQLDPLTTASS